MAARFFVGPVGGTDCESSGDNDDDDKDDTASDDTESVGSVSLIEQLVPPHCNEHESFFKSPKQP